jgi:glucose/arabinose dehydrogenase
MDRPHGRLAGIGFLNCARMVKEVVDGLVMSVRWLRVAIAGLVFLAGVVVVPVSKAQEVFHSQEHDFIVRTLVADLDHPWGMAFISADEILISERPGTLNLISDGFTRRSTIAGLPKIAATGQGGLLDIALHPKFHSNRLVYFSFAASGIGGEGTEVARGKLTGDRLDNVQIIFRALPKSRGGKHFGSRLLFGPDGYLYITLGERGRRPQAQALSTHPGSIIRLYDDGRVPPDNPFVANITAHPEIFTYGNRNVQGIALQPGTDRIWAHEHGPQGGDEVNIIEAGINYGWPVITYGRNYGFGTKIGEGTHREGMAQPVHQWTPSIAPSGMAFYAGDKFPQWRGNLFAGSLKFDLLVRLTIENKQVVAEERLLAGRFGRIRDVRSGPDGYIYLLTDESDGRLLRLEPDG